MFSFYLHVCPSPPHVLEVAFLVAITFAVIHFHLLTKVPLDSANLLMAAWNYARSRWLQSCPAHAGTVLRTWCHESLNLAN